VSWATNLDIGPDSISDVFVHDRRTGVTERVSLRRGAAFGVPIGGGSRSPAISADGCFVAFETDGFSSFFLEDANGAADVHVVELGRPRCGAPAPTAPDAPAPADDVSSPPARPAPAPVAPEPERAQPVAGRTQVAEPVRGTVLVRARGQRRFVELRRGEAIPDRSEIDATRGAVRLRAGPVVERANDPALVRRRFLLTVEDPTPSTRPGRMAWRTPSSTRCRRAGARCGASPSSASSTATSWPRTQPTRSRPTSLRRPARRAPRVDALLHDALECQSVRIEDLRAGMLAFEALGENPEGRARRWWRCVGSTGCGWSCSGGVRSTVFFQEGVRRRPPRRWFQAEVAGGRPAVRASFDRTTDRRRAGGSRQRGADRGAAFQKREVRLALVDHPLRGHAVACLADDGESGVAVERTDDPGAEQRVVVGDDHPQRWLVRVGARLGGIAVGKLPHRKRRCRGRRGATIICPAVSGDDAAVVRSHHPRPLAVRLEPATRRRSD